MWIRIAIIFLITFIQAGFFSNAEGVIGGKGDEEYHKEIKRGLSQIKKRLDSLENNKLRPIKEIQESLLNQIMAIRTSMEQVQATGELNKSEMLSSLDNLKAKLWMWKLISEMRLCLSLISKKKKIKGFWFNSHPKSAN